VADEDNAADGFEHLPLLTSYPSLQTLHLLISSDNHSDQFSTEQV